MDKDTIYKGFGLKLRYARKIAGLTQTDLAERVGLNRTSVTNIEKGRQGVPLHMFLSLASAVGAKPAELLPDPNYFIEHDLVDRKILEKKLNEEEGVGWAAKIISSGIKKEADNEKNRKYSEGNS